MALRTRDDIIEDAIGELGALDIGESPTTEEITYAARKLNDLVQALRKDRIFLHTVDLQNTTTIASTATIETEPATVRILEAWLRIDSADIPLDIYDRDSYDVLTNKSIEGLPTALYVDFDADEPTIYMYPVPDDAYTLYYRRVRELTDFSLSTDNPDFPETTARMLIKGLARDLAPRYRVPLQERVALAQEFEMEKREYIAGDTQRDGTEIIIPYFIV